MPGPIHIGRFSSSDPSLDAALNKLAEAIEFTIARSTVTGGANLLFIQDENGIVIDADAVADEVAKQKHSWQPYVAKYTGFGDPPSDQGRRINIRPGIVNFAGVTLFPSNKNIEITVPANQDEGYFVWLDVTIDSLDDDVVVFGALEYDHGTTVPEPHDPNIDTGTPPDHIYIPLFIVTTTEDALDEVTQLVFNSISIDMRVQNIDCITKQRSISWIESYIY